MELSLQIRGVLRGPLDAAAVASSDDSDNDISKPVAVPCPPHSFAPPAPTQAPPSQPGLHEEGQTVPAEPDAHVPVDVPAGVLQDEDRLYHKKGRGRDAKKKPTTTCCVFGADMSKNLMMGCCFCCSFVRKTTLEKCLRLFL